MSKATRYSVDIDGDIEPDENGNYVYFEDYEKLESELAQAKNICAELESGDWVKAIDYEIVKHELAQAKEENEFLKEYFMDALIQGCGTYHPNTKQYSFDHMCLSTYEHMVKYALKNGWITKEQVTR